MKLHTTTTLATLALALSVSGAALAQQQGVSKTEITIGTIQDLSGPLAGYGKAVRNGMLLRIDAASLPKSASNCSWSSPSGKSNSMRWRNSPWRSSACCSSSPSTGTRW